MTSNRNICLGQINICSLRNKVHDVHTLLYQYKIDVLLVTETWLTESISDYSVHIPGYSLFRLDRDCVATNRNSGGGVCFYVRECINASIIPTKLGASCETLALKVSLSKSNLLVLVGSYRMPSSSVLYWEELEFCIESALAACHASPQQLLLMGDYNINVISPQAPLLPKLRSLLTTFSLSNVSCNPTRFPSNSCLDLVLVPSVFLLSAKSSLAIRTLHGVSDHYLVSFELETRSINSTKLYSTKKPFRQVDLTRFKQDLVSSLQKASDRSDHTASISSLFSNWTAAVTATLDHHTPTVRRRVPSCKKPPPKPWMNHELRGLLRSRKLAHRKALSRPQDKDALWKYRHIRRQGTILNRRLKHQYYIDLLTACKSNPHTHWKVIKHITGTARLNIAPKAPINQLSNFFASTVASTTRYDLSLPYGPLPKNAFCDFSPVSHSTISYELKNIKSTKATGSDKIPAVVLKACHEEVCSTIANLFNESFEAAQVPNLYKLAHVTPIHKQGSRTEAANYRPISLLPVASKVLERLVLRQVQRHMLREDCEPLPKEQFAYRRHHSCEDLLLSTINDWHRALDRKQVTGVLFVDIKKAFDSVHHQQLIQDLFSCGVGGKALEWFTDYLSQRRQKVVVGHDESAASPCERGVPQGSVLGPYLFSIYLRSLPDALSHHAVKFRLFADDICIYLSHKDPSHIAACLSEVLNDLKAWLGSRSLEINPSKSQLMYVRGQTIPNGPPITFHGHTLLAKPDAI